MLCQFLAYVTGRLFLVLFDVCAADDLAVIYKPLLMGLQAVGVGSTYLLHYLNRICDFSCLGTSEHRKTRHIYHSYLSPPVQNNSPAKIPMPNAMILGRKKKKDILGEMPH